MTPEIWRRIEGYRNTYEVSDRGRVRNVSGKIMPARVGNTGYLRVALDSKKKRSVHRLVATAFLVADPSRPHVNHKDGDKLNNTAGNLEWCSRSQNMVHAIASGLHTPPVRKGESHGKAVLSDSDVGTIKAALALGIRQAEIIRMSGVKRSTINSIALGANWSHITVEPARVGGGLFLSQP